MKSTDEAQRPDDGFFRFACPSCGKRIKFPAEMAGKKRGRCPACGAAVALPAVSSVPQPQVVAGPRTTGTMQVILDSADESSTASRTSSLPRVEKETSRLAKQESKRQPEKRVSEPESGLGTELIGSELSGGRYKVTAKLGEGGMGFVYRAHDRNLETEVVIKVPRKSMLDDPEFSERFSREIRSLVRLAHPHIARIIDVGQHEGVPFAVMQFLPGASLKDRQQDTSGSASPPAIKSWLAPVAEALDFIHHQGFVHRDVKPANILFDAHGNAFLSDFGVAKVLAAESEGKVRGSLTGTGMVLGTPEYMSPEMIMGQKYDGRADQYALAITAYEILTGRCPFDGPTPAAILVHQTTEQPVSPTELNAAVPVAVSTAILQALSKDPNQRFGKCADFATALLGALGETQVTPTPAPPIPIPPKPPIPPPTTGVNWKIICLVAGAAAILSTLTTGLLGWLSAGLAGLALVPALLADAKAISRWRTPVRIGAGVICAAGLIPGLAGSWGFTKFVLLPVLFTSGGIVLSALVFLLVAGLREIRWKAASMFGAAFISLAIVIGFVMVGKQLGTSPVAMGPHSLLVTSDDAIGTVAQYLGDKASWIIGALICGLVLRQQLSPSPSWSSVVAIGAVGLVAVVLAICWLGGGEEWSPSQMSGTQSVYYSQSTRSLLAMSLMSSTIGWSAIAIAMLTVGAFAVSDQKGPPHWKAAVISCVLVGIALVLTLAWTWNNRFVMSGAVPALLRGGVVLVAATVVRQLLVTTYHGTNNWQGIGVAWGASAAMNLILTNSVIAQMLGSYIAPRQPSPTSVQSLQSKQQGASAKPQNSTSLSSSKPESNKGASVPSAKTQAQQANAGKTAKTSSAPATSGKASVGSGSVGSRAKARLSWPGSAQGWQGKLDAARNNGHLYDSLVTASGKYLVAGYENGIVEVRRLSDGSVDGVFKTNIGRAYFLSAHPSEDTVFISAGTGTESAVIAIDTESRSERWRTPTGSNANRSTITPEGDTLLVDVDGRGSIFVDAKSGEIRGSVGSAEVNYGTALGGGRLIYLLSGKRLILRQSDGSERTLLDKNARFAYEIAIAPDQSRIAAAAGASIFVVDLSDSRVTSFDTGGGEVDPVTQVAFADQDTVVVGSQRGNVLVIKLDVSSLKQVRKLQASGVIKGIYLVNDQLIVNVDETKSHWLHVQLAGLSESTSKPSGQVASEKETKVASAPSKAGEANAKAGNATAKSSGAASSKKEAAQISVGEITLRAGENTDGTAAYSFVVVGDKVASVGSPSSLLSWTATVSNLNAASDTEKVQLHARLLEKASQNVIAEDTRDVDTDRVTGELSLADRDWPSGDYELTVGLTGDDRSVPNGTLTLQFGKVALINITKDLAPSDVKASNYDIATDVSVQKGDMFQIRADGNIAPAALSFYKDLRADDRLAAPIPVGPEGLTPYPTDRFKKYELLVPELPWAALLYRAGKNQWKRPTIGAIQVADSDGDIRLSINSVVALNTTSGTAAKAKSVRRPIGVSDYSFWQRDCGSFQVTIAKVSLELPPSVNTEVRTKVISELSARLGKTSSKNTVAGANLELDPQVKGFLETIADSDKTKATRLAAVNQLGKLGARAESAIPALNSLVRSADVEFRRAAVAALAMIGKPAVPALIDALKTSDVRYQAIEALGSLGSDAKPATPALLDIALNDPQNRTWALQEVGMIGVNADDVSKLVKLLQQPIEQNPLGNRGKNVTFWRDWIATASVIEIMGPDGKAAVPALRSVLEKQLKGENQSWQIALSGINALAAIGPDAADALPTVRRFLDFKFGGYVVKEVNQAAEKAVARIKGE